MLNPDPCASSPCADTDECTVDVCTADSTAAAGYTCTNDPKDCGTQSCNPADGTCVDCLADADCDDGAFCNGAETCGADNACVAGADACDAATQTCNEDTDACEDNCIADADCPDDGVFCNGTESCDLTDPAAGVCVSSGDPCADDGLFCTGTESCDEATAACVASGDPCATGESCNDTTDTCDTAVACTTDADCTDDGLFCNGVTTCDLTDPAAGVCATSADPCTTAQTCTEGASAAVCTDPAGDTFTLTVGTDTFTGADSGTAGADTFNADLDFTAGAPGVQTLNVNDQIDGGDSTDTLNATISASVSPASLMSIEVIQVTNTGAFNLTLTNAPDVTTVKTTGNSGAITVANIQKAAGAFEVRNTTNAATFTVLDSTLSGSTDSATLTVASLTGDPLVKIEPTAAGSGYETLSIVSEGGAPNVFHLTDGVGSSLDTVNVSGSQDVDLRSSPLDASVTTFDASAATGKVKADISITTAATTVKGGSGDDMLKCGAAQNYTVTGGAGADTIDYAGNLTGSDATDCGDGTDDVVSISSANLVAADNNAKGLAAATNCEWLEMTTGANSAVDVDAAGTIGQFVWSTTAGGNVTLTNLLDTDKVKLKVSKGTVTPTPKSTSGFTTTANIELNGVAAVVVTALAAGSDEIVNVVSDGTNGNTITTLTAVADGTTNITGSKDFTTTFANQATCNASAFTGKLTVTGSGAADTITGGSGVDTITGGAGGDTLTGNGGADVFTYPALTNSLNTALDTIEDFTSGTDQLDVPVVPVSLVPSGGADVTVLASVVSTGTTTGTLATDIGTANAAAAANAWDQAGDVCIVQITGASIGGTDVYYMIIEEGTAATAYNAAADAVIQLGTAASKTFVLADFK